MDTTIPHCDCPLCDGTAVHIVIPEGDDATNWHYTSTGVYRLPIGE